MRYLGIDFGRKRIGLALSDAEGRIAFPHKTVGRADDVFKVIEAEGVDAVVIGLPVSLDGTDSEETRAVRAFAAMLSGSLQLPMAFESEVFTTKIAEAHSSREHADASAAALILQSYLDRISAEGQK